MNEQTRDLPVMPQVGLLEWFWINDYEGVEQALHDMRRLGVQSLRMGISWADYLRPDGQAWYDWLMPKLASQLELLPCITYTPPSLGEVEDVTAPPRDLKAYADFVDLCITRYGEHFEYVELWNEANNIRGWNCSLDWTWEKFAHMVNQAAYWAHQRGKKTVLGGMSPIDPQWLCSMGRLGVLAHMDVVGIHGFPGSYDVDHFDWNLHLQKVRQVLTDFDCHAHIWVTEAGYSTWQFDEHGQLRALDRVLELPVDRVYWLSLYDLKVDRPSSAGWHKDARDYHFGLKTESGREKLLYRVWAEQGLQGVRACAHWPTAPALIQSRSEPVTLITGGAGFIGANLADRLASLGRRVRVLDNLSRPGVERNLNWLQSRHQEQIEFIPGDLRNPWVVREAVAGAQQVFHFAGQVAVTSSMQDPMADFQINLQGTMNLLEELRRQAQPPGLIFTSTNKVYGALEDIELTQTKLGYHPVDPQLRRSGVNEDRRLDFHSPYGCSKGGADQYVLDYARYLQVPAVVFRMSCIYGPLQMGTEDQGWVAHFLLQALQGAPITLYGDGHQVRDILYVTDLINAFLQAEAHLPALKGQAFNMGGGPANAISLHMLLDWIESLEGCRPQVEYAAWRPGDQLYYVSDTHRFSAATGWQPSINARAGVERLHTWLAQARAVRNQGRAEARTA